MPQRAPELEVPLRLHVTAAGMAEEAVRRALGLSTKQMYSLHSDVIGSPRHYRYRAGRHYYTADGVRALAQFYGLHVEVITGPAPSDPAPWWLQNN